MAIETMGAALQQINQLFAAGVMSGLSDSQLLERFLTQADVEAFEVLVGRHGPMVLSVCRAILRDPHDAEDAFQATFLVLVKTGGTIRGRDALAGWLHRIAHRVAHQANLAAARRRRYEKEVGQMAIATSTNEPAARDDLLPVLHQEIARLPEKLRVAIVHCDLEGMTQAQAAEQLHLSRRTLQLRLAEGRLRLKRCLAGRGVAPDGAALEALLLREGADCRAAGLARSDPSGRGRHRESYRDRGCRLCGSSATGSGCVPRRVASTGEMGVGRAARGWPDRLGGVGRVDRASAGGPKGGDRAAGAGRPATGRYRRPAPLTGPR